MLGENLIKNELLRRAGSAKKASSSIGGNTIGILITLIGIKFFRKNLHESFIKSIKIYFLKEFIISFIKSIKKQPSFFLKYTIYYTVSSILKTTDHNDLYVTNLNISIIINMLYAVILNHFLRNVNHNMTFYPAGAAMG